MTKRIFLPKLFLKILTEETKGDKTSRNERDEGTGRKRRDKTGIE